MTDRNEGGEVSAGLRKHLDAVCVSMPGRVWRKGQPHPPSSSGLTRGSISAAADGCGVDARVRPTALRFALTAAPHPNRPGSSHSSRPVLRTPARGERGRALRDVGEERKGCGMFPSPRFTGRRWRQPDEGRGETTPDAATLYARANLATMPTPPSVILGLEPKIHATTAAGCGVDARVKPEHDGGWGGSALPPTGGATW